MRRQRAFSYAEALVATVLIAVALVPAIEALQTGIQGSALHTGFAVDHYRVLDKIEQTAATPYAELADAADAAGGPTVVVPPPFSDPPGTESRRLVYLARYDGDDDDGDGDGFSGADDGLIWVRVRIADTHFDLETLLHE